MNGCKRVWTVTMQKPMSTEEISVRATTPSAAVTKAKRIMKRLYREHGHDAYYQGRAITKVEHALDLDD